MTNQSSYAPILQRSSVDEQQDGRHVDSGDIDIYEQKGSTQSRRSPWHRFLTSPIWFFVAALLLTLNIVQLAYVLSRGSLQEAFSPASHVNSYADGFNNEFEDVRSSIETYQTRFTSAIRSDPDGSLYMAWADGEPRYTTSGGTHEEVDAAWDALLSGRYIQLSESESDFLNADRALANEVPLYPITNLSWIAAGSYGGPDMLHSLHCLNGLRKHLDLDYYDSHITIPHEYRALHLDHCIDQLRQAVMCHADMTPVTLRPVTRPDGEVWSLLGETEYTHTCRNGAQLRNWWWERGAKTARLDAP